MRPIEQRLNVPHRGRRGERVRQDARVGHDPEVAEQSRPKR
jgi:hypothetical protein